ncbi:MAG: zinc-binding dehydrogenase [Aureliella sp.]
MKAAFFEQPGPPDVIQYGDVPKPEVLPHQVLVKIAATSLNPIDTYIRAGANYWPLPSPFVVGCDFAGTVEAVGAEVGEGISVGERVWGSNQGLLGRQGTFAEYAAVDAELCYPSPDDVDDKCLAACSLVGITAHLGVVGKAKVSKGDTVFVRGGVGGVGSMVLQMCRALGAIVIATAGSPEKAALCKELGAEHVINYNQQDIASTLGELAPGGVDVFWETLRDPDFDLAVGALADGGRMVLMAGRDARPEFPVGPFYVKGLSMHGVVMFKATPAEQHAAARDINRWLAEGKLRSVIDRVLPLSKAAEAHQLQEDHTVGKKSLLAGKIVLTP